MKTWAEVDWQDADCEVSVLDTGEVELVLGDDVFLFDAGTAFNIGAKLQAAGMAFAEVTT